VDKASLRIWASLGLLALALIIFFHDGEIDHFVSSLFFDSNLHVFPIGKNASVDAYLYRGMKFFMGAVFLVYLLWGVWSLRVARVGFTGRHLIAGIAGTGLTIGLVNLLKVLTGVECPWSTEPFGGTREALSLAESLSQFFSGSPGSGRCFPAGHPTGGLYLLSWAVSLRASAPVLAGVTAVFGFFSGALMGLTRIAQGAHFLSHVLWSVWLAVVIAFLIHTWIGSTDSPYAA
jgi:membrane-associated PAP2 superfamily phosphatase